MAVGLLLAQLCLTGVVRVRAAHTRLVAGADRIAAHRMARLVPRAELRRGRPGRDWTVAPDSITLRAFRGSALACASEADSSEVVVLPRGERAPDLDKDSVLLVRSDGSTAVAALLAVREGPERCRSASGAVWRLDRAAPADVVLGRLFERGSYHLADGALRYRSGDSGRQPLTAERFDTRASGWSETASGARYRYVLSGRARPLESFLARSADSTGLH